MDNAPSVETPEWFGIVRLMDRLAEKLPTDWDHDNVFWLDSIQEVAKIIVDLHEVWPTDRISPLLTAGSLMAAQVYKDEKARDLTAALFARLNNGGQHD